MLHKSFHKGKYYISFKRGFDESKKDITISVDKLFDDSLKLTLSDDDDPMFLCRIQITRCDYEELKKQQGLLIDFDNFPSQVVRLLQQCTANNMFLILNQINPATYNFEVVEHNEFKRLIHLSLKTGPACDDAVKQHMAETISDLKKSLSTLKNSASSSEALWNDKCAKIEAKMHEITLTLTKMEEDKHRREIEYQEALKQEKDRLAQEKLQLQKAADLNAKNLLTNSQQNLAMRDKQIEEFNHTSRQLRDNIAQLERQISDKTQRTIYLEKEVQKFHLEVTTLSGKNTLLDREINEREKQIHQLNIKCNNLEKTVKDNSDVIKELSENVQSLSLEKNSLERRLSLSESLANRNNEAAQSTSEQLVKANQIISKQNNDIIEMKDKLLCRTAIALEQEKVIDRNTKEIQDLKLEIKNAIDSREGLKTELDTLKEKYELNEMALKDKDETIRNNNMVIQWLHKKMEDGPQPMTKRPGANVASSTPYFLNRNNSVLHESDESINFYGTSKSNIEDSPNVGHTSEKTTKGLDPKYLKPVSEDNKSKRRDLNKPTSALQNKGKENKNVELPKVDYREKKSSKPTTYRATPVSAYFP